MWVNLSQCLTPDYDLESGILDIIATLRILFPYLRVKSHQDDETKVHLIPWTAQMIVHAGALTTDYLDTYSEPSNIILFIPKSKASLTIDGETITHANLPIRKDYDKQLAAHKLVRSSWT